MKYQLLFWTLFLLSFSIDIFNDTKLQAKPAPIFQPILSEIKERIPDNLEIRLPAFLPPIADDLNLDSFIPEDDKMDVVNLRKGKRNIFTVLVLETSDCNRKKDFFDCLAGIISVTETTSQSDMTTQDLPPDSLDITPLELNREAKGFYFVRDEDYQFVVWKQNKIAYIFITEKCHDGCVSKQDLISMAKSAANEPAITSSDLGYYKY